MTAAWGCCPAPRDPGELLTRADLCHVHADRAAAKPCGVLLGGTPELVRLDEVRRAVYCVAWSLSSATSGRLCRRPPGRRSSTGSRRLAIPVGRRVVHHYRRWSPLGMPFAIRVRAVSHQLLLPRVHRDCRLSGRHELARGPVDVLELRVATRINGAFLLLAQRLRSVAQAVNQATHSGRTHPPSLVGQRRFARPLHPERSDDIGPPPVSGSTSPSSAIGMLG